VVHRSARAAQTAQQAIGQHLVILNNQNSHVCLLCEKKAGDPVLFAPILGAQASASLWRLDVK
jgi:hypothetical protein